MPIRYIYRLRRVHVELAEAGLSSMENLSIFVTPRSIREQERYLVMRAEDSTTGV
jgi:hypothetical protein